MTATTLTFEHPRISAIAPFGDVHAAVLQGHWSVAALICAEKAARAKAQQDALDTLARTSGLTFAPDGSAPHVTTTLDGDILTVTAASTGLIVGALDLYTRLLCGQWRELDWVCALNSTTDRADGYDADDTVRIRQAYGRTRLTTTAGAHGAYVPLGPDEWPDHVAASISIAQAVLPARIAYHAYKMLGGGTPGGPTFALPDGPLTVRGDHGHPVNKIRAYT